MHLSTGDCQTDLEGLKQERIYFPHVAGRLAAVAC